MQGAGEPIDNAVHDEHRLGSSSPTVGRMGGLVGQHGPRLDVKMRDTEQAEHVRHGIVRLHDAPGVIGALVHQHAVTHRHNTSITPGGHFNVVDLLAGMN